eukprot:Skav226931  [mRNA]  locus=scaffold3020:124910:125984:+ [translate_table: standard]
MVRDHRAPLVVVGLILFATLILQGCNTFYEDEASAMSSLCAGHTCEASCRCCVQEYWAHAEACDEAYANGNHSNCGWCFHYADEEFDPKNCKSDRNFGHCGHQYWNNEKATCEMYNETCGEGIWDPDRWQ